MSYYNTGLTVSRPCSPDASERQRDRSQDKPHGGFSFHESPSSLGPTQQYYELYELISGWCAGSLAVMLSVRKKAAQLTSSQPRKAEGCSTDCKLAGWVEAEGNGANRIRSTLPCQCTIGVGVSTTLHSISRSKQQVAVCRWVAKKISISSAVEIHPECECNRSILNSLPLSTIYYLSSEARESKTCGDVVTSTLSHRR